MGDQETHGKVFQGIAVCFLNTEILLSVFNLKNTEAVSVSKHILKY